MTSCGRTYALGVGGLVGVVGSIVGLVPVLFLDAARRAGSIGKLSATGLLTLFALVLVITLSAGFLLYRIADTGRREPADLWVASFLGVVTWGVGILTLLPGLVFLRLSDNRSLNDYGARFFLEAAAIHILIAAAAFALGRWSLQSLASGRQPG